MSPFRRKDGATYYLHMRWKGWPEIRVATGTTNKSRAVAMEKTIHALRSAGRRDLLELIAAGRLRLEEVHDAYTAPPPNSSSFGHGPRACDLASWWTGGWHGSAHRPD